MQARLRKLGENPIVGEARGIGLVGGIELVAIAAGEAAKPHRSVPRAIKATFIRILLFYILTIFTIGLCINYQDTTLLNAASGTST